MIAVFLLSCFQTGFESLDHCQNNADCSRQEQCHEGQCIAAECRQNQDCSLAHRCFEGQCIEGCDVDMDCMAGSSCMDGVCQEQGCRNAQLDCGYGEDCLNGACLPHSTSLCELCSFEDWQISPTIDQSCIIYTYDREAQCDVFQECEGDALCYPADGVGQSNQGFCTQAYWFEYCEEDVDCPRPFTCHKDIYGDGSNIHVCWGDCPTWKEMGIFP